MANQAEAGKEELKKHGDALDTAVEGAVKSAREQGGAEGGGSAIPPAEHGGHARSAAAHLEDHAHLHNNHNAVQHHVPMSQVSALREPPQEVSRNGKDHRGQ